MVLAYQDILGSPDAGPGSYDPIIEVTTQLRRVCICLTSSESGTANRPVATQLLFPPAGPASCDTQRLLPKDPTGPLAIDALPDIIRPLLVCLFDNDESPIHPLTPLPISLPLALRLSERTRQTRPLALRSCRRTKPLTMTLPQSDLRRTSLALIPKVEA